MTPGNPNASQTSYATNYYNLQYNLPSLSIHPSEPNYVWQEAGLTGPLNAPTRTPTPPTTLPRPTLSALLQNAGIPWKSYQENITWQPPPVPMATFPATSAPPGCPPS